MKLIEYGLIIKLTVISKKFQIYLGKVHLWLLSSFKHVISYQETGNLECVLSKCVIRSRGILNNSLEVLCYCATVYNTLNTGTLSYGLLMYFSSLTNDPLFRCKFHLYEMIQYYGTLFDMGFFLFQIHIIKLFNIAFEDRLEKLFKKKSGTVCWLSIWKRIRIWNLYEKGCIHLNSQCI